MAPKSRTHFIATLEMLVVAIAVGTNAFAGPLPVPTLDVYIAASEKDGTNNATTFDSKGPVYEIGSTSGYNNQAAVGTNFATANATIGVVHVSTYASVGIGMGLSPGEFNTSNAQAIAGFTDSFESPSVPVSVMLTWIANGTTSDSFGANDVNFGLIDDANGRTIFRQIDLGLGGSMASLSSYPVGFWTYIVPVPAGVPFTFDYSLDVVAGASCGYFANGFQSCTSGFADYSNTGGVMINELDANGAAVPGNPDLIFASGLDYSNFNEPPPSGVPEPSSIALLGIGLAGVGFRRRSLH